MTEDEKEMERLLAEGDREAIRKRNAIQNAKDAGKIMRASDGTLYQIQPNGSWKKIRDKRGRLLA